MPRYRAEREADLEKQAIREVRRRLGVAFKFKIIGRAGAQDRLVILPGNCIGFLELKNPNGRGRERTGQKRLRELLQGLSCICAVAKNMEQVNAFLDQVELLS